MEVNHVIDGAATNNLAQLVLSTLRTTSEVENLQNRHCDVLKSVVDIKSELNTIRVGLTEEQASVQLKMATMGQALECFERLIVTLPELSKDALGSTTQLSSNELQELLTQQINNAQQLVSSLAEQPLKDIPQICSSICEEFINACNNIEIVCVAIDDRIKELPSEFSPNLYLSVVNLVGLACDPKKNTEEISSILSTLIDRYEQTDIERACEAALDSLPNQFTFRQRLEAYNVILKKILQNTKPSAAESLDAIPIESIHPIEDELHDEEPLQSTAVLSDYSIPGDFIKSLRALEYKERNGYELGTLINESGALKAIYALVMLYPKKQPSDFSDLYNNCIKHFGEDFKEADIEFGLRHCQHLFLESKFHKQESFDEIVRLVWSKFRNIRDKFNNSIPELFNMTKHNIDEDIVGPVLAPKADAVSAENPIVQKSTLLESNLPQFITLGDDCHNLEIQFPSLIAKVPTYGSLERQGLLSDADIEVYNSVVSASLSAWKKGNYALHDLTVDELVLLKGTIEKVLQHSPSQRAEFIMDFARLYLAENEWSELSSSDLTSLTYYRNRHKTATSGEFTPITPSGQEKLARIALSGEPSRDGNRRLFTTKHLRGDLSPSKSEDPIVILAIEEFLGEVVCRNRHMLLERPLRSDLQNIINLHRQVVKPFLESFSATDPKSHLHREINQIEKMYDFLWRACNFYDGQGRASGAQYLTFPFLRAAVLSAQQYILGVNLFGQISQTNTAAVLTTEQPLPQLPTD